MEAKFKFIPLHFNWVAIHPKPIGVIQVIGGAFFGTFPTIFYRYICKQLFDQGFTIIALPYRFTLRHWSVSIGLVRDQSELRQAILTEAKRLGYDYRIYQEEPTSDDPNYFWLGHSLGCKYIALLELLSDLEEKPIQEVLGNCVGKDQEQEITNSLRNVDFKDISLKNQPSILMAPVIQGIESAVPFPALANLVKKLGIDVKPTVEQSHCLIKNSNLFNLISLIAFKQDKIAPETVNWLKSNLPNKPAKFSEIAGEHLAPLGFRNGNQQITDEILQSIDLLSQIIENA